MQASGIRLSSVNSGFPCMDPGQTLWVAPPPPYQQNIFVFVNIVYIVNISFSLTWDPMGAKFQNSTPPVFMLSKPNFMINEVVKRE